MADSAATAELDHSPAMLISHGCSIDKKDGRGRSKLEYLTFVPLQNVALLPPDRATNLRASLGQVKPYEAMYLGEVPRIGECYVMLTRPYTLPAALLQAELRDFTAEETGEAPDARLVAGVWDTRVGCLSAGAVDLFQRKWVAQWARMLPPES